VVSLGTGVRLLGFVRRVQFSGNGLKTEFAQSQLFRERRGNSAPTIQAHLSRESNGILPPCPIHVRGCGSSESKFGRQADHPADPRDLTRQPEVMSSDIDMPCF